MSEAQLTAALIRQADEYPAGAFGEIGSWDDISALERRVFRAVGKAHLATNPAGLHAHRDSGKIRTGAAGYPGGRGR